MSALASKLESQKIFEKLKTKPANRVSKHATCHFDMEILTNGFVTGRYALIVGKKIRRGLLFLLAFTCVWTVPRIIGIWVFISPLCAPQTSIVCTVISCWEEHGTDWLVIEWQWDQLRIMKVGGNESATKFFQSNGGTAALNSKDPTTKYTSNAATKYKDELKRRAEKDVKE